MHMRSPIPGPTVKDPQIKVRAIVDLYVAGEIVTAGSTASMQRSDADALASIGRVAVIK
jgi:hypothetical protein